MLIAANLSYFLLKVAGGTVLARPLTVLAILILLFPSVITRRGGAVAG